ncbi:MAG TPA: PAS domain-containing protein [Tissierellia bacterium]|nr:PAS domain-containing protein [Tissierellia bacterium]
MNKRILLYSLTLVLAVALIFGLLGTINAKQDETAAKFATMARFATFVSNQYEAGQVDQLDEAEAPFIFGIQIHNRQGRPIYESPQFHNIFGHTEINFSQLNEAKVTSSTGQRIYVFTRYSRDIPGYVSIFSRADQGLIQSNWRQYLIGGLVLAMIAGGIWSLRASRTLRDLADRFITFFQALKEGDHTKHIYVADDEAVGEVAFAANSMVDHIEQLITRLNRQAIENEAVFGSIAIGVIAVDRQKLVLRANSQAGYLFEFDPEKVVDRNILEVIRNSRISDAIDKLLKSKKNRIIEDQLRINYTDIRVLASPILDGENVIGVVLTFEDVTGQTKLQEMRRDFVSNVSHELKTPLTSIKGFTETMIEAEVDPKTRHHFLSIINQEVDRLNDLVTDLFVLSEIEKDERSNTNKEWFDPYETLDSIVDMLDSIAQAHERIEVVRHYSYGDAQVYGNVNLFKQLVINLFENGVKYSKPEGGRVTIRAQSQHDQFVLEVSDEGIGINKVDAQRIFERFYRVDKARSLDVPGTGLGLAIAKHIVISFRGTIDVKSVVGEGSTFIVKLPLGN